MAIMLTSVDRLKCWYGFRIYEAEHVRSAETARIARDGGERERARRFAALARRALARARAARTRWEGWEVVGDDSVRPEHTTGDDEFWRAAWSM